MTLSKQAALAQAATHLDDAIEHLTFERFDWAFEDLERATLHLAALRVVDVPALTRVVEAVEALQTQLVAERREAACFEQRETIAAVVFDASDAIVACAARAQLTDPGTVYGALSGAWEPSASSPLGGAIPRRDALRLIAAGSLGALAACAPAESAPSAPASPTEAVATAVAQPEAPRATVRTVTPIAAMQWPTSDPFLFCAYHVDHYPAGNGAQGPSASLAGRSLGRDFDESRDWRMYHGETVPGFPRHPHRGFETVTVVRTGMLDHADSMGALARYGGGDVQWLTAGGGIQHAEMFPLVHEASDNPLEMFQIWMNLPARNKMVDPHFTMLWSEQIPKLRLADAAGRSIELMVAAGEYAGHRPPAPPPNSWASQPGSDVAIWALKLAPGAEFTLPAVGEATERSLYLHEGQGVRVGEQAVANRHRVELAGHGEILLVGGEVEAEVLLLQGRPIGEPVARRGPFVMNTQEEIRQAYSDYQRTGFGGWPWAANDPVHGASRGRFAQRPDGTVEEPA